MSKFIVLQQGNKKVACNLNHIREISSETGSYETSLYVDTGDGKARGNIMVKVSFDGVMKSICESGDSNTCTLRELDQNNELVKRRLL